jgi:hypothetical protein
MPLKGKKFVPVAMRRHRGTGGIPPATADRVPLRQGTELQPHRSPRHRPARRGAPSRKVGVYEEEFPTWKSPVTDNGYMKSGVTSEHRGGRRVRRELFWGQSSGSGTPVHPYLNAFIHIRLTLGFVYTMSRYTMSTRPRAEQPEDDAREDLVDLRRRRTQGRLRGAKGVFSQRFPPSRGGLRPFASQRSHRTSIGSRGIAADCDRQGGAVTRDLQGGLVGVTSMGRGPT